MSQACYASALTLLQGVLSCLLSSSWRYLVLLVRQMPQGLSSSGTLGGGLQRTGAWSWRFLHWSRPATHASFRFALCTSCITCCPQRVTLACIARTACLCAPACTPAACMPRGPQQPSLNDVGSADMEGRLVRWAASCPAAGPVPALHRA